MSQFILLLPIALPVLFWAAYHWHVDRHLPEPPGHLALAFLLGVGAHYLGAGMYELLGFLELRRDAISLAETSLAGLLFYSVLAIGLIEESAKMLPFLLVVLRFREFDEPLDGIIYGSFIALGFAAMENMEYLDFLEPGPAYARGFAGPVIHIVFASIWAYYIGRAWLFGRPLAGTVLAMLVITAVLHGIYDFIVIGLPAPVLPVSALLIAGLWIWRLCLIRDLRLRAPGPAEEAD